MRFAKAAAALLSAIVLPCIPQASAQDYPNRPIRMVIPWPPGGVTDVVARSLAQHMSDSMGQPIVADNRPGAAGTVGVGILAKSPPDGYTIMMSDVPSHAISASLYTRLPYDPVKEVEPVALPSRSPLVLVVNPKLGVKSITQLIDYAKSHPKEFSFASSGAGSITHLTAERFIRDTKIKALHVPYKGGNPATAALVAGEANMYFACISAAIPHIKAGRLTLLGITAPKRTALYPDTPVLAEVIPGWEMGCNTGLFAPGGTPAPIIQRLHAEAMKAVQQPKMKEILTANSAEPSTFSHEEFKQHVAQEMKDWGAVVRAAGLKVD